MSTSNQHYGKLNERFDGRARRLARLGYVMSFVNVTTRDTVGVWTRKNTFGRSSVVTSSSIMHADDYCWADIVAECERFAAN